MPQPRTHPLRRVSTGSLSSLARSQDRAPSSASGLDFLTPALVDLSDEAAMLASNIQNMSRLHDALGIFNESFAGYLYALRMNAFCVEWPEAPDQTSFARAAELSAPLPEKPSTGGAESAHASGGMNAADATYATVHSTADDYASPVVARGGARGGRGGGVRGGAASARGGRVVSAAARTGAAAEKKKREAAIHAVIETLPLEYRGGDAAARQVMEKVLTSLMLNPNGRKVADIVSAPLLPQAKVNKALIALVQKKLVTKTVSGGVAVYKLS